MVLVWEFCGQNLYSFLLLVEELLCPVGSSTVSSALASSSATASSITASSSVGIHAVVVVVSNVAVGVKWALTCLASIGLQFRWFSCYWKQIGSWIGFSWLSVVGFSTVDVLVSIAMSTLVSFSWLLSTVSLSNRYQLLACSVIRPVDGTFVQFSSMSSSSYGTLLRYVVAFSRLRIQMVSLGSIWKVELLFQFNRTFLVVAFFLPEIWKRLELPVASVIGTACSVDTSYLCVLRYLPQDDFFSSFVR